MASKRCIAELAIKLGSLYGPDKFPPLTPTDLEIWHEDLQGLTDEQVWSAFERWDEDWPPSCRSIRRLGGGERRYADRAHRPMELTTGEPTERTASTKALLEQARASLGNVVDLDERRSS